MADLPEPWWPLRWDEIMNEDYSAYYTAGVVGHPHVIRVNREGDEPNAQTRFYLRRGEPIITPGHDDDLTLRCALLELTKPEALPRQRSPREILDAAEWWPPPEGLFDDFYTDD
jgi:hypothetical protein